MRMVDCWLVQSCIFLQFELPAVSEFLLGSQMENAIVAFLV